MTSWRMHALDPRDSRRTIFLALLFLLATAVVSASVLLPAPPGRAAGAAVEVSPRPAVGEQSTVTLSGTGFQYVPNAPGGIYVFFGVVSDTGSNGWAPSQGGVTGESYRYAGTPGSTLLVAFDGGDSAESASSVIDASGAWSAEFVIPGSEFSIASGNPHDGQSESGETIDCLVEICGIITIGAHGNVNANNETFTPISFAEAPPEEEPAPEPDAEQTQGDGEAADEPAEGEETADTGGENADAEGPGTLAVVLVAVLAALILAAAALLIVKLRGRSGAVASMASEAAPSSNGTDEKPREQEQDEH